MRETSEAALSALDSKRFGVVAARADAVTADAVPALLSFFERHSVELLIARCDGADLAAAQALSRGGLSMIDAQITYQGPVLLVTQPPGFREAVAEDAPVIADLARRGFSEPASHYHGDVRLSPDACRETYVDWALRGLAGACADVVFLAEVDGRTAAFGMFEQSGDEVRVLLSTVAPWVRGHGLYLALLDCGMAWGSCRGANTMIGITSHSNISAQRSLIKAGLRPVTSTWTFHGWWDQVAAARCGWPKRPAAEHRT